MHAPCTLTHFFKETGCMYSKRMSNMYPPEAKEKAHLVYKFVIFDCVHYGYTRSNPRRRQSQRRVGFCFRGKVGCKSTMRISTIKGYVEIVTYEMKHNHPASLEPSDEYQPQNWLLSGINMGEDDKAFRRRRRRKTKQPEYEDIELPAGSAGTPALEVVSSQLERLRELAMLASEDQYAMFAQQLAQFEADWQEKLLMMETEAAALQTSEVTAALPGPSSVQPPPHQPVMVVANAPGPSSAVATVPPGPSC